eukprot:GHVP01045477.1.p1 GENE.GHVP01045477.1~~GHVP01045477.1.p1  ORF type:complete len:107 (+),score=7.60 GHVP01045477.1:96-416(+)
MSIVDIKIGNPFVENQRIHLFYIYRILSAKLLIGLQIKPDSFFSSHTPSSSLIFLKLLRGAQQSESFEGSFLKQEQRPVWLLLILLRNPKLNVFFKMYQFRSLILL